jgi:hypothetical protein
LSTAAKAMIQRSSIPKTKMLWDFPQILEFQILKKTITAAQEERSDGKKM